MTTVKVDITRLNRYEPKILTDDSVNCIVNNFIRLEVAVITEYSNGELDENKFNNLDSELKFYPNKPSDIKGLYIEEYIRIIDHVLEDHILNIKGDDNNKGKHSLCYSYNFNTKQHLFDIENKKNKYLLMLNLNNSIMSFTTIIK